MRIVCISALRMESRWLVARLGDCRREKLAGRPGWQGELHGRPVTVLTCGMGPDRAAESLAGYDPPGGVTHVFHLGVCGALDRELGTGDVCLFREVGASYRAGEGFIGLSRSPAGVSGQAFKLIEEGRLISHRMPVFSRRNRDALRRRFSADCVDMEAWEVARWCGGHGLPLTVVKAVSDSADEKGALLFPANARRAAENACRAVHDILKEIGNTG